MKSLIENYKLGFESLIEGNKLYYLKTIPEKKIFYEVIYFHQKLISFLFYVVRVEKRGFSIPGLNTLMSDFLLASIKYIEEEKDKQKRLSFLLKKLRVLDSQIRKTYVALYST